MNFKKAIAAIIAIAAISQSAVYAADFTDIKGHWAEATINALADKGVVNGVSATLFKPEGTVTRAEFLKMAMEASNIKAVDYRMGECLDASEKDWFNGYLQSALDKGLIPSEMISNYSVDVVSRNDENGNVQSKALYNGAFVGNLPITREEMAAIAQITYQYSLNANTMKNMQASTDLGFADTNSISTWALAYVKLAYAQGFIMGMDDNTFLPKATVTRAQAATIVSRILDKN
jgi:hypothetical protein